MELRVGGAKPSDNSPAASKGFSDPLDSHGVPGRSKQYLIHSAFTGTIGGVAMAYVDWAIKGPKIASCSCDYGCPCEFNGKPTEGLCEGLECMLIEEGWFGDLRLDGLKVAAVYRWPGPVHEGGGVVRGFFDANADQAQIDALFTILGGKEQEPTTVFNIYGSTIAQELEPIFAPIEFHSDIEKRTGGFRIDGHLELELEPIRNPVTGAPIAPASSCRKASSSARRRSQAVRLMPTAKSQWGGRSATVHFGAPPMGRTASSKSEQGHAATHRKE